MKIKSGLSVTFDRSIGRSEGAAEDFFPLENLSSGRLQLRAATCEM